MAPNGTQLHPTAPNGTQQHPPNGTIRLQLVDSIGRRHPTAPNGTQRHPTIRPCAYQLLELVSILPNWEGIVDLLHDLAQDGLSYGIRTIRSGQV